MARNPDILVNSIPGRGFKGMREDKDPRAMDPGECISCKGFRLRNGILDGKTSGSGSAINTTAFGFDIYDPIEFVASNGKTLILALTSTGKIIYTNNGWLDWDNEASVKSFAETADGTDLVFESGSPHLHISWVVRANRDVVFSNGVDSYIIDGTTWPTSGALKVTTNANLPPFVRGLFLSGRTLLDDGERCWLSSPNDPNRFRSTLEERLDTVFDDNQWAAAAAQGVSGYNTALCQINETSAFLATQNGVFWIGLAPDEDGIARLNIICALKGAGCTIKNAAYVTEFGLFIFYSSWNGGSWLMMGRGSYANLPGDPIALDAEAGFFVREMAPGIRKSIQSIYSGDSKLIGCGKDTQQEFEQVSAKMRLGADTASDSGWMALGTTNKLTYTPSTQVSTWDAYDGGDKLTMYFDPAFPVTNIKDGSPTYSDIASPTYFKVQNWYSSAFLCYLQSDAQTGIWADNTRIQGLACDSGWQEITINRYCSTISLNWWYAQRPDGENKNYVLKVSLILYISTAPQFISKIRIFGLSFTGTSGALANNYIINIGEIEIYGTSSEQATYIDHIQKMEGLTALSQRDFGRFLAGFRKIDSDYYPIFKIRVGKSATLDTLTPTSTLSAATLAGAETINVVAITTGVEIGDKITITDGANSETRYIAAISSLAITPDEPLTYAHTSGLTVTYTGSAPITAANSNWSPWTTLTLAEITAGYKFSALRYRTASANTPAVSDASGNLWTHVKVTMNLKKSVGLSPAVDFWRFQCLVGTLKLANHFMASAQDNSVIFSAPLAGATDNNMVFGHKMDLKQAGSFILENQELKGLVRSGSDYLAFMGRSWVKYWTGYKNYNGTSSAHTPLVKEWHGSGVEGEDISPLGIKTLIRSYEKDSSGFTCAITAAELAQTPSGSILPAEATQQNSLAWGNNHYSVVANDGYEYFLVSWKDTTTTGKSAYTYNSSLDLIKLNRATGAITRYAVDRSVNGDATIGASNIILDEDGTTLHLIWVGLTAAKQIRLEYNIFDTTNGILGTENNIATFAVADEIRWLSAGIGPDKSIHVALTRYWNSYNSVFLYKSVVPYSTWALEETITDATYYFYGPRLYINKNGNPILLALRQTSTYAIYEYSDGAWGSTPIIVTASGNGSAHAFVVHAGEEYLFHLSAGTVYCYKNSYGTWGYHSIVSTAAALTNNTIAAFTAYDRLMVSFTNTSSAFVYYYKTSAGSSWAAATIKSSYAVLYCTTNGYIEDNYMIIWTKKTVSDYFRVMRLTITPVLTDDESELIVSLKTNASTEEAYNDDETLLDSYQPADGRVPQTGKVNYIRPKIRTTSPVEIASCDLAATK